MPISMLDCRMPSTETCEEHKHAACSEIAGGQVERAVREQATRRPTPVAGADLRAALVASCFRGALPPVDLRAVCFVRAIVKICRAGDTSFQRAKDEQQLPEVAMLRARVHTQQAQKAPVRHS